MNKKILLLFGIIIFTLIIIKGILSFSHNNKKESKKSENLVIYSLYHNDYIKDTIDNYNRNTKDIKCKYIVGCSFDNSIIKEDAIKKLNNDILSNKGPDIIVLDDLPYKKYADKHILTDLKEVWNFEKGNINKNIYSSINHKEKINFIPLNIVIPIAYGKNSENFDMESLTKLCNRLNKNTSQNYLEVSDVNSLLWGLYPYIELKWYKANSINQHQLRKDLPILKKMYLEEIAHYKSVTNNDASFQSDDINQNDTKVNSCDNIYYSFNIMDAIRHNNEFGITYVQSMEEIYLLNYIVNRDKSEFCNLNIDNNNYFIGKNVIGINKKSRHNEKCIDFVKKIIENQNFNGVYHAIGINKSYWDNSYFKDTGNKVEFWIDKNNVKTPIEIDVIMESTIKKFDSLIDNDSKLKMVDSKKIDILNEAIDEYFDNKINLNEAINKIETENIMNKE